MVFESSVARAGALAVAVLLTAASARAATIIDGTTLGYYNNGLGDLSASVGLPLFPGPNVSQGDPTINPAAEPNLAGVANLGTWLTNAAPSGGTWSAGVVPIPATWAVNTETAIVYVLEADTGLTNLHLDLGVDNGIFVWLDGDFLFGALAPGGANINEYDVDVPGVLTGTHYLQILREDHGGATGYAILVSADRVVVPVSEPMTLALLALVFTGLAAARRRR